MPGEFVRTVPEGSSLYMPERGYIIYIQMCEQFQQNATHQHTVFCKDAYDRKYNSDGAYLVSCLTKEAKLENLNMRERTDLVNARKSGQRALVSSHEWK